MDNIIIGKHALESLTTGMYADPFVIFREYIQNAADAIDEALNRKILDYGDDRIEVVLSPIDRKIAIKDNGVGISITEAEKALISIGNSKKAQGNARGFRGIGRLAALGYCGKLVFETSSYLEKNGTRITINARKLSERLLLEENNDVSAEEVLKGVYTIEIFDEKEKEHYFNVMMEELDVGSELNNYNTVYDYLTQSIPVAYDLEKFVWGKEIKHRIESAGYRIPEYNVILTYAGNSVNIYKPYQDSFAIDKNGSVIDSVKDVEIIELYGADGDISTFGWIAHTDYLGSIYDKRIKGIRIRKGNILIGDGQTLNVSFKDARFNGWVLGELFVVDSQLIPNARRDNFEKNSAYFTWMEKLVSIFAGITKEIRAASVVRNNESSKVIHNSEETKEKVSEDIEIDTFTIRKRLVNTKAAINSLALDNMADLSHREIAFDEIDMLIGKVQGSTAYKSLNVLKSITKSEKKILEKVFDVIVSVQPEESEKLIDSILKVFIK